jgi:hypothetical protein
MEWNHHERARGQLRYVFEMAARSQVLSEPPLGHHRCQHRFTAPHYARDQRIGHAGSFALQERSEVRWRHSCAFDSAIRLDQIDGTVIGAARHGQLGDAVQDGIDSIERAIARLASSRKRCVSSRRLRSVMSRMIVE